MTEEQTTIDNAVFSFAGVVVLAGLALGWFVSPWWFLLTAFAGLNMRQGGLYRLLPGGNDVQAPGPQGGQRLWLTRGLYEQRGSLPLGPHPI